MPCDSFLRKYFKKSFRSVHLPARSLYLQQTASQRSNLSTRRTDIRDTTGVSCPCPNTSRFLLHRTGRNQRNEKRHSKSGSYRRQGGMRAVTDPSRFLDRKHQPSFISQLDQTKGPSCSRRAHGESYDCGCVWTTLVFVVLGAHSEQYPFP